jgi:hypothetical protein
MKNYIHKFTVEERKYADIDWRDMSECELSKSAFVESHLSPTLKASKCGWNAVQYRVMETPGGTRTEFLVLWADEIGTSGSRWINVTGDSLGSIMCAMCDNLW